ncbi:MAG: putative mreD [Chlamydiota bacterium]
MALSMTQRKDLWSLSVAACVTLTAILIQAVATFSFTLLPHMGWMAYVCLTGSFRGALWASMLMGVFLDLLSEDPIGVHALNATLVTLILYRHRRLFTWDRPFHFAIYTSLGSFLYTLMQLFLSFLFDRRNPFEGQWILGDLFVMPLADGVYSAVCLLGAVVVFQKIYDWGHLHWHRVQKKLFPTLR